MADETSNQAPPQGAEPRLGRSVSLDHAAELLGVSRRTIYNRIREGRLVTIRTLGGSQRVLFQAITDIGTQGEDTLVLTTERPFPSLRNSLAHPNAGLVSPKADGDLGDRYGVRLSSWTGRASMSARRATVRVAPRPTGARISPLASSCFRETRWGTGKKIPW